MERLSFRIAASVGRGMSGGMVLVRGMGLIVRILDIMMGSCRIGVVGASRGILGRVKQVLVIESKVG
jgi:hypothetical protein